MKLQTALLIVSATALSGCVSSQVYVLKNPATGAVKECSTNSGASLFPIAQTMIDNTASESCAKGYQAAGWVLPR